MKINGSQIITGMYIYNPSYEYTKDDFVISDGVIYICTKNVVGEDPKVSDSFTVYLGDKGRAITFSEYKDFIENLPTPYIEDRVTAFKEYLDFMENSEGSNKYITVGMLQAIMSYYLLGPTGKGIIGDYICYDQDGMRVSLKTSTPGSFTNPETIISDILFHPDINNAILRVSRFLPEINGYVGSQEVSEYSGEDQKSVILRQYTYIKEGESGERIRLQELIDPVDGVIWYRTGNMDTKLLTSSGTWKCSIVNSRTLKTKVESIIGVYTSRLKVLSSLETHLKSNFRYRKLDISDYRPTFVNIEEEAEITVTVSELTGEGLIRNYQTTINLEDKTETGSIPSYLIGDKYRIDIVSGDGGYSLRLLNKSSGLVPENAWFSDAFYKEYYGLS